jgi:exonuclease III
MVAKTIKKQKVKQSRSTRPKKIRVITYNMSWATQINKTLGSEADFVKECKRLYKKGGIQCTNNAIKKLSKLPKIHLMGIQEVNSKIESKIKKVQPCLAKHIRGKLNKSDGNIVSVSILYDPKIFGKVTKEYVFNLRDADDPRPCLMVLTSNNFLLINLHSPWETETIKETIQTKLSENKTFSSSINPDTKIIVMGDFNDNKSLITKQKPLVIFDKIKVTHNKTRKELNESLKSCCWHEKTHKYGHFDAPGDYILINNQLLQETMEIPKIFNKKERQHLMFSDHKPVMSVIRL